MKTRLLIGLATLTLAFGGQPAWADEPHGGPGDHGAGYGGHDRGMKGQHGGVGHFLRHLLRHQKELGLSDDQVAKIKAIQLELDKTRIRTEAEIDVTERELHELINDDKADLATIEAKLKHGAELAVGLRLAAVKAKREALALLTPEQREKEKAEHEKMMHMRGERRMGERRGMGHGHGQGMPSGGGPGGSKQDAEHSGPTH